MTCLKEIFNKAIDSSRFEGINPARKIKKIDEPLNRIRFLTDEEERTLLGASQDPLRTIILVGIYAGFRIQAEALTLKWENVDLERKLLTVEAAYARNGETETIPMNSRLVVALKELQKISEFVFTKWNGTPYRSVTNAFKTACRRANLRGVTPHTSRHTFASRFGMSGANDRTIQALGRWKEPKMIQHYAHLSKEHRADAVERIASNSPTVFTTSRLYLIRGWGSMCLSFQPNDPEAIRLLGSDSGKSCLSNLPLIPE